MDLLDALVDERGRAPAARVLGVNCRTPAICCGAGRSPAGRGWRWWIVVMPGGSPDDKADMAYSDDTLVVGDTSAVMGPVSATGARGRGPVLRRGAIPGRVDGAGIIVNGQEWGGLILVNTDR